MSSIPKSNRSQSKLEAIHKAYQIRSRATTGKCIVDNGDNGTTTYPDADQIGHFKFASGVPNDMTTLMAYNQATLKYKYLLVYVED